MRHLSIHNLSLASAHLASLQSDPEESPAEEGLLPETAFV